MLTEKQLDLFEKIFKPDEHRFVQKNLYLDKQAIRRRLARVDSAWSLGNVEIVAVTNDVVVMRGELTISGVTRSALGTGIITTQSKDKTTGEYIPLAPFEIQRQTAKAYKTAQSDLLPRCAVQFGVGYYLPSKPISITAPGRDFNEWLRKISGENAEVEPTPAPVPHPAHWAHNGGGEIVKARMAELSLKWSDVANRIESGRALERLSDTTLTVEQFLEALATL